MRSPARQIFTSGFFSTQRVALGLFLLVLLICLCGVIRTCFLPEDKFLSWVIIDDATYNLIPARHLLEGKSYSFDTLHATNGVQPLWAAYSILIALLCADVGSEMRILVLSGALLWMLAGLVLFLSIRRVNPAVALLSSTIWCFAGFSQRVCLEGMENGLCAFLLACVAAMAIGYLWRPEPPPRGFFITLGIVLAFVAVCRVELVMLPALLTAAVFLGWFRASGERGPDWRNAANLAAPTAFLFGVYVLINVFHYGGLLPVSGAVKSFYSSRWLAQTGFPFGGFWGNLQFHLKYPWQLTLGTGAFMLGAIPVSIGGVLVHAALRRRFAPNRFAARFVFLAYAFVGIHLLLLALWNPFFTLYGIWYFTPEMMATAIGVSTLAYLFFSGLLRAPFVPLSGSGGAIANILLMAISVIHIAQNRHWIRGFQGGDTRPSMMTTFQRAGIWLDGHIAGSQQVATISSGMVNTFATHHNVVNLDGLINDYDYFRNYLTKNRQPEYVAKTHIGYFADYAPVGRWKGGLSWAGHIGIERMQLLRWWILPNNTDAYAIWRILPPGTHRDILDGCEAPCDRMSQIQMAALELNRYPVVADLNLPDYLGKHGDQIVATSFVRQLDGAPEHVLMTEEQLRSLHVTPSQLDIERRMDVTFGGGLTLLGFDAPNWRLRPGQQFVFTRFWYASKPLGPAAENARIEISVGSQFSGPLWSSDPGAHGSFPLERWRPGDAMAETYSVLIPVDIEPGTYPVRLGIRDSHGKLLPSDSPPDTDGSGMLFVGNLEVN